MFVVSSGALFIIFGVEIGFKFLGFPGLLTRTPELRERISGVVKCVSLEAVEDRQSSFMA